jgi:hypothetical protein
LFLAKNRSTVAMAAGKIYFSVPIWLDYQGRLNKKSLSDAVTETPRVVPLTCHGHSRPITHLSFSSIVDDDQYYLISACKGGFVRESGSKALSDL